jgi:uncharacterized protein
LHPEKGSRRSSAAFFVMLADFRFTALNGGFPMNVFVTGATGFVGSHLTRALLESDHDVTSIGRSEKMTIDHPRLHYLRGDATKPGPWQEALQNMDAVINLAGVSIFKRWDEAYKKILYDSRILTTRNLVEGMPENRNAVLISTSAAGYYGQRNDDILMENEPPGNDFLATLCRDWEAEAFAAVKKGVRVAVTRFGVVLGKNGGALNPMIPLFKWFLGGPLGSGKQWFPWIHVKDLTGAIRFILDNTNIHGPLNFTAPIPVRQKDFARFLGRQLGRPAILPAPAFMIRLILGELGQALMFSQKVIPDRLIREGYKFRFMEVQTALGEIIENR